MIGGSIPKLTVAEAKETRSQGPNPRLWLRGLQV